MKHNQLISLLFILLLTFSTAYTQIEKDHLTIENLIIDNFYNNVKDLNFEKTKRIKALDQLFGVAVFNSYRVEAPRIDPVLKFNDSIVSSIECFIKNVMHTINPKLVTPHRFEFEYFYSSDLVGLDAKIFDGYSLKWHVMIDGKGVHQIHIDEGKAIYKLYEEGRLRVSGFYEQGYDIDTTIRIDPHTYENTVMIIRRDTYVPDKVGIWKYYNQSGEMIREENHDENE